ncbi:MAG: HEPN domain-containing protein [Bacillota bacterium]
MRRDASEEARRWVLQAQRDLDDARYASDGGRFNLACFLAQQAAEKALKGFLYSEGAETVWGHSVAELCLDAAEIDVDFKKLIGVAGPLDKYYIPTRYPNGLPGGIPADAYTEGDAQMALSMAQQVLDFIQARVGS